MQTYPGSDVVAIATRAGDEISDSVWHAGTDFSTTEELAHVLLRHHPGQELRLVEVVRPKEALRMHSLEIVTMRGPGGQLKVLIAILWTDCARERGQRARPVRGSVGYTVDIEAERIVDTVPWYAPPFADLEGDECEDFLCLHQQVLGVRAACEKAVMAHLAIEEQWVVAVTWQVILSQEGEFIFLQGCSAWDHVLRCMFLSTDIMRSMVKGWFWPFGNNGSEPASWSNSVQPHS